MQLGTSAMAPVLLVFLLAAPLPHVALARLRGNHADAEQAQAQLSNIMSATQMSLARATRHHERVVKKVRGEVDKFLSKEAVAFGGAVRQYAADMRAASTALGQAVNTSKLAVAKAEASSSKTEGWNSPGMKKRTHLQAQIAIASQEQKRAERRQGPAVKAAEVQAQEPLEDETTQLSRKVGDLSEFVETAKTKLAAEAERDVDEEPAPSKLGNISMDASEASLQAARTRNHNAAKEAEAKMDKALLKVGEELKKGIKQFEDEMTVAQKKEINRVKSVPTLAPVAKAPAKVKPQDGSKAAKPASMQHKESPKTAPASSHKK